MDSLNYVAPAPGGFTVVVNGKPGGTYPTQAAAEQVYNQMQGAGPVPTYPNTTTTPPGFTSGYATSLADQTNALQAAGYNGPWDPVSVQQAYARTYGGGNAGQASAASGVSSFDPAAGDAAYKTAALAAQTAYQNALIKGASDRLAFDYATQAWTQSYQGSLLSGQYNGQPTLAATTQEEANAIAQGQLGISQGQLTGQYNGQPTLAAQQQNNTTALGYLGLLKGLSGPANAFDYAHVLTGTPGGLADIVRAAGGGYQMPAFGGGSNQAVAPLSIQSMIGDVSHYSPTGQAAPAASPPGAASPPASGFVPPYAPPPTPTPAPMSNAVGGGLGSVSLPPWMGGTATTSGATTTPTPMLTDNPSRAVAPVPTLNGTPAQAYVPPTATRPPPQLLPPQPGSADTGASFIPQYGALPAPSQIAPQAYNRLSPSQLQLLLGAYGQGANGQNPYLPQDVAALYQKSLGGYGGPIGGAVGF